MEINLPLKRIVYEISATSPLQLHRTLPTVTLRGAFGYSLLDLLVNDTTIPEVKDKAKLYKNLFFPDGMKDTNNSSPTRPYIMRGFYNHPMRKSFILEMILIGEACDAELLVDNIINNMCRMGLGKNQQVCRVEKINSEVVEPEALPKGSERLFVHFQTPVRIKHKDSFCYDDIPFGVLIKRLIDRLNELGSAYTKNWEKIEPYNYVLFSRNILSTVIEIERERGRRQSTRTGDVVDLSGITGTFMYEGDFSQFAEILAYLPWVNVGKSTVFGCGWACLEVEAFINENQILEEFV